MSDWYRVIERRIQEFYESPEELRDFVAYLKEKQDKFQYICIWGVGNLGRPTAEAFKEHHLRVDFYCDNDSQKWGKEFDGIKCLSVDELSKIKDQTLVIICARAYKEIFRQLNELGYPHLDRVFMNKFAIREYLAECQKETVLEHIREVMDICADGQSQKILSKIILEWLDNESGDLDDICTYDQYFCKDVLKLEDQEVFVDCGAYNGDTLQEFLKIKGDKFSKLILFELSADNFGELEKNVSILDKSIKNKVEIHNKGVSDKKEKIVYFEQGEGSSAWGISGNLELGGGSDGYLTTIDEECKGNRITYIKMDIEGSEMAALKGAEQCIRIDKPKLAVCLYHKPQDIWELPLYIKKILPEYHIYIRHHTDLLNETVCYAVI